MNLPFIKYMEAMVVCKYPVTTIREKINGLPIPLADKVTEQHIAEVYKTIMPTNPNYFKAYDILPDLDWLSSLGIAKFVAYDKKLEIPNGVSGIKGAFEILEDQNMYEVVSSLALAKINQEDIELIVNGKFNIHFSDDDINEFINYFFNVRDWSLTEKKQYVQFVKDPKLTRYYGWAIEGDKDYLLWKLGIAPQRSVDEMLRDMVADAFYFFKEKQKANPDEAQKWASLAVRIKDKLEATDKDNREKISMFEQIQFILEQEEDQLKNDPRYKEEKDPEHIPTLTELRKQEQEEANG